LSIKSIACKLLIINFLVKYFTSNWSRAQAEVLRAQRNFYLVQVPLRLAQEYCSVFTISIKALFTATAAHLALK
jgi:hypothetical protein